MTTIDRANKVIQMKSKFYIDTKTGIVKTYDGWFYKKGSELVNAVDLGEVVPAKWAWWKESFIEGVTPLDEIHFICVPTGSIGDRDDWWYEDVHGKMVNGYADNFIQEEIDGSFTDLMEEGRMAEIEWDEDEQEWAG